MPARAAAATYNCNRWKTSGGVFNADTEWRNMTDGEMLKQAEELIAEFKGSLGLEGWKLRLEVVSANEARENFGSRDHEFAATTTSRIGLKIADVIFNREIDWELQGGFDTVVVHEMLHIAAIETHADPIVSKSEEEYEGVNDDFEQFIDRVARALLATRKERDDEQGPD
jgi:hypothetical protein